MSNYSNTKATIAANVYTNHNNEVTAEMVKTGINAVVDTLIAGGFLYKGVATTSTNPGSPDANVFYIATAPGTYTNFGSLVVADGEVAILKYNGSWSKEVTGAATAAEVSALGQKVDGLALGKFYGFFPAAADLPAGDDEGYAYVGASAPFAIYVFDGSSWSDSGSVYSYPVGNGEDIDLNGAGQLQFANRTSGDGMGYKILRKDATFASQVTDIDTIYEIRYDFDLGGASVTIPAGCVLKFNGGSIFGGSISNLGDVINANNGLKAEIISLSNAVKCFVASQYSVTLSSDPAYNQKALQAAINADIPIVIDTPNCDYDEGIEIAGPLYVATNRIDIKGVGGFSGGLVFPNSDGFVWNQKLYYFHNFFDCLTISANGYAFNFVNEVTEGVANPDRPYNIYQSRFTNLQVKSATKDCFYQGGVSGVGGDAAMVFQVYFGNIRLSTPRYGFNGINGNTDFVVEKLTDGSVPESFFYNTSPSVVRYVNSSFSRTKHFMEFGGTLLNFGIPIKCEFCSFEGYTAEIFKDDIAPNLRGYSIELNDCAISYYSADFPSGLNLYPITLSSINVLRMSRTKFPGNLSYASGYELVRANAYLDARSDTPFKVYYGAGASPTGYYLIEATTGRRSQRVGQYPNFVNEIFVPILGGKAVSAEFISLYADSVSVDSTTTPAITKMMTKLTASANRSVDYITLSLFADEGGVFQSGYENFGKVLFFYNDSNYNITFNAGYANSIVDPTMNGLVMRPKEFMIVIYDNSKVTNKFVAIQRMNGFVRYGHTSERPSLTAREAGFSFYDRDILKMILWNGTAWVNMDGSALS